jgi:hypothetical protein
MAGVRGVFEFAGAQNDGGIDVIEWKLLCSEKLFEKLGETPNC